MASTSACSQFFVLSPRGDTIISKEFRGDVPRGSSEIFFRKVKFEKSIPPVFNVDGINYLFIKKGGLFFAVTSRFNVSPSLTLEFLDRLVKVFKDYCGVLTEEAIRKNFILIYELLDEMMDYGHPQQTSTEVLKSYVFNEPIPVALAQPMAKLPMSSRKTTPSSSVHKPISLSGERSKNQKNEIFVDILERLTVVFNSNGYVLNSEIDGCIQMKSYLSGNPGLRIALNDDLAIGSDRRSSYGGVVLDDCNFHECVNLDEFDDSRVLTLIPPDGEFVVMNYRLTGEFSSPFRIFPFVEEMSPHRIELIIKVRADIPETNYGANVRVVFPVPQSSGTVTCKLGTVTVGQASPGQTAEYSAKEKHVVWNIKKFQGGSEQTLCTAITLTAPSRGNIRKEIGPISLNFEVPMYNVSNLQVKYLKIMEAHRSYKPFRWVRYVTQSASYVCRL